MADVPLFPESASHLSEQTDNLFWFLFGVSAFISVLIFLLIAVFAIKYHRRAPNEIGAPISGSLKLEIAWTVIPFVIAMIMFAWGARLFFNMAHPPPQAMQIFVVAKQWMWKAQHPEGRIEINELHVPVNRDVMLTMTSQDVIHDLFIPAFRIKADVLPNRYTSMWFRASKPGRYHLFCAEYCGTNHALMGGWVTVMEPADFEDWLSRGERGRSMVESGAVLFQNYKCANCHVEDGSGHAPSLMGVYGAPVRLTTGQTITADDAYLRESILNPRAKIVAGYRPEMPSFQRILNEEQVLQLIAYIKTMSAGKPLQTTGSELSNPAR
ncbi:MAG: cytochrome c oxidase subunit II [Acidobacteria bacterium]|nr:cytochrome c oxidase subunit II [Acidobacteriota bacterium]